MVIHSEHMFPDLRPHDTANSLSRNILPASPYSAIFCGESGGIRDNKPNACKDLRMERSKKMWGGILAFGADVQPPSSNELTSSAPNPRLEVALSNGQTHQWGRHGFDGDACGQEACRGAHTRNRVQNDNCQSTDGIRSLIR